VVPNWGVSLVGGVQPEKLQALVSGSGLADDGLLQRMMLYSGRQLGKRLDRKPDEAAAALYEKLIERATELKSDLDLTVTLEPDAQPHRERVWTLVEAFKVMPWAPAPLKEHLSKWPSLFARLLLVLHAAECLAGGDEVRPVVVEKTAKQAADLMVGFFLPHALRAYREFFGNKTSKRLSDPQWVAAFLLSKERSTVTRRDVKRSYRALAKDDKGADQTLRDLEIAGWVRRDETAKSDSSGWLVNPKIYLAFPDRAKSEAERRQQVKEEIQKGAKIIKGEFRH
jgi:hypothetical protein